jgi:hypothetical protein
MGLLARASDYTSKDFDSLRVRLQSLVRSVFPDWTDFNVANFGNILLELYAFVGDVLLYYQDNQARESRLLSATQRRSLLALCKLLGFRPAGARAATADVVFSLPTAPLADVTIPRGTKVRTASVSEAVSFQLVSDVVIPAGATPPSAMGTAEHSEPEEELFVASGLAGQELVLASTPYLDNSAAVSAGNGDYAEVTSFLGSGATDRHYTVVVDQNDRAIVRFGSGINGVIPSGTVTVRYKTGGGAHANVNAGMLVRVDGPFVDANGNSVSVSVTNPRPASGGCERQSMAQIKALAPESIRVLNRTVSREDFEINARRLPEVARALMLTSNEDGTIAENTGVLFIVPRGGGLPSQALKAAVLTQVTVVYPATITFQVSVQDPVYLPVNLQATIHLRQGASPVVVRAAIQKVLADFFAVSLAGGTPNPAVDFGWNVKDAEGHPAGELALSDIFDAIRDVSGVRKIGDRPQDLLLNGAHADLPIAPRAFPTLGTVTLTDARTGLPL